MIRFHAVLHILGLFLLLLSATMLVPVGYGLGTGSTGWQPLLGAAAVNAAAGLILFLLFRRPSSEFSVREGIFLVATVWFAVCLFGCLPFYFSPQFQGFTDAVFETASGFTTTGATILPEVEVLPPPIQFWRHFMHWLGGMGVVLLGIAVLPLLGAGGMSLYRAEFSGARSEKLKPRLAETTLALWRIYVALTLVQYLLLRVAGMNSFDALCHSFSTMGTGGFSTRTASVAGFQSPLVEYIIIVFMILAGMNFTQHYRLWIQREARDVWRDFEIRGYLGILFAAAILVCANLLYHHQMPAARAVRESLFQVASITTTTGFATADFEKWPPMCHAILLSLMFIGGCTGSTAGGWKMARVLLMSRLVYREFKRTALRRGVFAVRLGDEVISEQAIRSLLNLVYLSLLVFLGALLAVAGTGVDLLTSISAVAAAMFSVGPGLGTVGPVDNYSHIPLLAKWVLSFCMVAGRLEFYTALVIFTPAFWRK